MTKTQRFELFLARLTSGPPAQSRQDALDLMSRLMNEIEDEHSGVGRGDFDKRMRVWGWEFNWKDLQSDPCYWDDSFRSTHRTQIYHSGRIVISRLKHDRAVILDKQGAH